MADESLRPQSQPTQFTTQRHQPLTVQEVIDWLELNRQLDRWQREYFRRA
jgi:hypothetical protein